MIERARSILIAAAAGTPIEPAPLALAVLTEHPDEIVRLAAAVLAAEDRYRGRRAIELAAALLEATADDTVDGGASEPGPLGGDSSCG